MMRSFLFACLALGVTFASPLQQQHSDWQARAHPAASDWRITQDTLPAETLHTIAVYLKHADAQAIEEKFWAVSDPDHQDYSQYLSPEELTSLVAASPETMSAFLDWTDRAVSAVQVDISRHRDHALVTARVGELERAFGVRFARFERTTGHALNRKAMIRSPKAHEIPSQLAPLVDWVKGVSDMPMQRKSLRARSEAAGGAFSSDMCTNKQAMPTNTSGWTCIMAVQATTTVHVSFVPFCADGKPASNATKPCGLDKLSVTLQFTPLNNPGAEEHTFAGPATCTENKGQVQCSLAVGEGSGPGHFQPYKLSVSTSVDESQVFTNRYPVVKTRVVLPQTIRAMYNRNGYVASEGSQAVVEFEQQYYSPEDLAIFLQQTGLPPLKAELYPANAVNNVSACTKDGWEKDYCGEANLDVQFIMGVGVGVKTTVWNHDVDSTVEIDDILAWANHMSALDSPPSVNSLSYGMTAKFVDPLQGKGYLARSDIEFQKLALRGITIIIACGDTGAGDLGAPPMSFPNCTRFNPDWPSQSPFVTAVGSTYFTPFAIPACYADGNTTGNIDCQFDGMDGEVSVSLDNGLFWTTGGGFADTAEAPKYQEEFLETYFSEHGDSLPPQHMFNKKGRAYPDFVAVGHNLNVVMDGHFEPIDGTSASAPVFAGIISLLNDVRIKAGQKPLGFINPLLYKIAKEQPGAFYDVTVGDNGSGSYGFVPVACEAGFKATPGFDAASGLGSPNFEVLRHAVLTAAQSPASGHTPPAKSGHKTLYIVLASIGGGVVVLAFIAFLFKRASNAAPIGYQASDNTHESSTTATPHHESSTTTTPHKQKQKKQVSIHDGYSRMDDEGSTRGSINHL